MLVDIGFRSEDVDAGEDSRMDASPRQNQQAFTIVELLTVLAVLAIMAALLLAGLARSKAKTKRMTCVSNLKDNGLAFRIRAADGQGGASPMARRSMVPGPQEFATNGSVFACFRAVSNDLVTPRTLNCPADVRVAAPDFRSLQNANVSYFIGLDANETKPQMPLMGDRNVTNGLPVRNGILELRPERAAGWTHEMHQLQGNVGLVDGSVQCLTNQRLLDQLRNSQDPMNRVAIP